MQEYKNFYSFFDFEWTAFLLNVSVCIALAVILIGLFRPIFGKKFRGSWRYALWIVLPLCFLLPVRIKSSFSLIPIYDYLEWFPIKVQSPPLVFTGISDVGGYQKNAGYAQVLSLGDCLIWIIPAVFLLLMAYQIIKLVLLDKRVKRRGIICKNASYREQLENICAEFKIPVPEMIIFPEADTPFAMGIIRPKIILPRQDYSEEELGFILRHETVHIKRKDILLKLLMIIFRSANWFNPFAYIMCRRAFEDMEITCDERATAGFTEEQRSRYSEAILKGVSKGKYPAVTTYLSSSAKTLKKRISAVMTLKKLSGAIPFAVVFAVIMLCSVTVYSAPSQNTDVYCGYYLYMDPYSIEETPYNIKPEWRTCEADSAEEAGRKIFAQYMEMYMGEDVPEYYRINSYCLTGINAITRSMKDRTRSLFTMGAPQALISDKEYCSISYNIEYANKCGNTSHHAGYLGNPQHFNGYLASCYMSLEMEKHGRTYTLTNIGSYCSTVIGSKHFFNAQDDTVDMLNCMAKCGLLDYDWDPENNLPKAEQLNAAHYLFNIKRMEEPEIGVFATNFTVLKAKFYADYLHTADNVDENGRISIEGFPFKDEDFEFCGAEFDCETLDMTAYGNVTGENPHGVILKFEDKHEEKFSVYSSLVSVTVTDELYTPVVYHDSFDNIPLPESLAANKTVEGAKEIMEYMKTPRDGSDFTVLDYRNITMENGEIFAEVKFKGRLDGVYSSDLKKHYPQSIEEYNDGFIRTKIV